jgi:hypothetical protein
MTIRRNRIAGVLLVAGVALNGAASAEPYFAVREGMKCASCHVAASGGGMRTPLGNAWAHTVMPARKVETAGAEEWTGSINPYLAVGGNLRAGYSFVDLGAADAQSQFDIEEARAYLGVNIVPGRLLVYVDQRVAPGTGTNLEAYARYSSADQSWYVRAGQLYLPYGWRLEDDSAFVRQVTGINFAAPDRGLEVGWEAAHLSAQLAVTNGTAAGPEVDRGKQVSLRVEHIQSSWRLGAGANYNDADAGARRMEGVFAGLRTGPIAWLAEADRVTDDNPLGGKREQWAGLLEGNWSVLPGHNLKLTAELFEPDADLDEDEQNRYSIVWEYTPIQFAQLRIGARVYDGIPQSDLQNRKLYFISINGFF